jgi:hypothetical protein
MWPRLQKHAKGAKRSDENSASEFHQLMINCKVQISDRVERPTILTNTLLAEKKNQEIWRLGFPELALQSVHLWTDFSIKWRILSMAGKGTVSNDY